MNPARLLALLTDQRWPLDVSPVALHDPAYEYLLRFCEVNRNALIERLDKEGVAVPTAVLLHRMTQLLLQKWDQERDYRFLNVLCKFKAKRYLDHFPKNSLSQGLKARVEQIISREFKND